MSKICCLDIESLGVSSESVILSAAVAFVEVGKPEYLFQELLDNTFSVKFQVKEQVETYNRTIDKNTIEWWKKQTEVAKNFSFFPSKKDLSASEGISLFRKYIESNCDTNSIIVFIRGSLDQCALDSLTNQVGQQAIFPYSSYRDCRTYIECCAESSNRGYCEINQNMFPDYHRDNIWKHVPVHDCVLDLMMILSC